MKIILTGSTGFIGAEVLKQCLANPSITSIVALSRKPLPVSDPKLTNVLHEDYSTYPPALLAQLKDAKACIWAQGIAMPKSSEDGQRINLDYPLAGARALHAAAPSTPFRFVYVSGSATVKQQDASVWFMAAARKLRGRTEVELLALPKSGEPFEVFVARPAFVLASPRRVVDYVIPLLFPALGVDVLARNLIKVACGGGEARVLEMSELTK